MPISLNCCHCKKNVTSKQKYVVCGVCSLTYHVKCLKSNLSLNKNNLISVVNYTCQTCMQVVFHFLLNKELEEEFTIHFEINPLWLNEMFADPKHVNNCDMDSDSDDEITKNLLKDVYKLISAEEVNSYFVNDNLQETSSNNYQISTLCINARSIVIPVNFTKIEGLITLLDYKPDVIGVTETWEQPNSFGQYKCLPGYTFVSNGKIYHRGGGVGMYVKNSLSFYVCNDLSVMDEKIFESIFINIQFLNKKITCGTIYRSPQHNKEAFSQFFCHFKNTLTSLDKSKNKCFIMGDFNIDLLDIKNENTETYVESMFDYNFYPLVNKPTRITKDRCSCIDHILTNMIGSQIKSAIVAHEISGHLRVIQVSNVGIPLLKYENNEWCFIQPNLQKFYQSLETKTFEDVYNMSDPDDSFKVFMKEINPLLVQCFKYKKKRIKIDMRCVWYDRELLCVV